MDRQKKRLNRCRRENFGVALTEEKMMESLLRWFGYVLRILIETPLKMEDQMEDSPFKRGRGRPKKNIRRIIKKELLKMAY